MTTYQEHYKRQIATALQLLRPAPAERTECVDAVADALIFIDYYTNTDKPLKLSAAERRAVTVFINALRKVPAAQRGLPPMVRLFSFSAELDFKTHIAAAQEWLDDKPLSSGRPAALQEQLAVGYARNLLERYGLPVKCTRGSDWYRLAGILLGRPRHNLYWHMCQAGNRKK